MLIFLPVPRTNPPKSALPFRLAVYLLSPYWEAGTAVASPGTQSEAKRLYQVHKHSKLDLSWNENGDTQNAVYFL